MPKKKDLTNQKYGLLTVIEPAEPLILKNGKPRTKWLCKCDCGNETIVATQNLTNGTTTSCGCVAKEKRKEGCAKKPLKEVGKKYNHLTIINVFRKDDRTYADCICDCGTRHTTLLDLIKRGNTSSCGCKKNDSKLEKECCELLNESKINFARQYTFKDCKYKKLLQFDFALFDNNNSLICLIECQGIQHYIKQPNGFGDVQREITDPIKREYCKNNNIKLYIIKYNNDVEIEINKILSECMTILCQASKEEGATTIP